MTVVEDEPVTAEAVNPFAVAKIDPQSKGMMEVAASRQAQEVQAAMVIAKKFPRNNFEAFEKIMEACKRKSLAEEATYTYPRGSTTVEGPSIRLAEVLAQQWGNIDFGIIELEQRFRESTVMAYAWDLETNTRQTKVFTVPHKRDKKSGGYFVTEARDIYEIVANSGARRLRSCILGVIPGDIVDAAVQQCDKTLMGSNDTPLEDRIRKMVEKFGKILVTREMIEKRLGHKIDATTVREVVQLGKIFNSIDKNMAPVDQFFEVSDAAEPEDATRTLKEKMASKIKKSKNAKIESAHAEDESISDPDPDPAVPAESAPTPEAFVEAYSKLNSVYDNQAKWIDEQLFKHGSSRDLPDLQDTTDPAEMSAVIETAKYV